MRLTCLPLFCCLQEIDELVEDWAPEPLVETLTPMQDNEAEKLPVLVG